MHAAFHMFCWILRAGGDGEAFVLLCCYVDVHVRVHVDDVPAFGRTSFSNLLLRRRRRCVSLAP